MKINYKQTKLFSKISNDKNRIHLDKKFAKKFFVKEPIIHGANLAIFALSKFIKKKKRKILIENISLNFKNFVSVDEKFQISILKDKIIIHNEFHTKLEIFIKYRNAIFNVSKQYKIKDSWKKFFKYEFKKLENIEIIKQIIYSSYYIGTVNPGNGSLILNIKIEYDEKFNKTIKTHIEKKIKNIYVIRFQKKFLKSQIIASKLIPYKNQLKKSKFNLSTLNKLKDKKILIFGSSSDIGERFNNPQMKETSCKIYKHSFRVCIENPNIDDDEKEKLKKKIIKIKPNYIFYFSSPKIMYDEKKNSNLHKYYKTIFVDYLKLILELVKKNKINSRIFYPSTFFLNDKNKYKRYNSYLSTKQLAEKVCNSKNYKRLTTCVRLPKIASRSNYNLLGFYEGKDVEIVDKYIERFF